jgi:hypothetical protein
MRVLREIGMMLGNQETAEIPVMFCTILDLNGTPTPFRKNTGAKKEEHLRCFSPI